MANAVFTSAWWKANKAKTLSDAGDTVEKSLKVYEADLAKAKKDFDEVSVAALIDAVKKVDAAAAALQKKANKTLHKETIGYLADYQTDADKLAKLCNKLIGDINVISKMTVVQAMAEKAFETFLVSKRHVPENFRFLSVMLKTNNKGNQAIYDMFIPQGSKMEINIAETLRIRITPTDGSWKEARDTVEGLIRTNDLGPYKAGRIKALGSALP